MTHEERRKRLKELREEIRHLTDECPHEVAPQKPGRYGYGGASCMGCGQDFGWYCPESPDHVCHYFSCDGEVDLIGGKKVPVPADHDPRYETDDSCIFCGHPDERK